MAVPFHVKILEQCHISPPPNSSPSTSLPLTFLDIPWLLSTPTQLILFYKFPHSKPTTHLSILKHTLSLTLQHFHPLAGKLSTPPPRSKPHIIYTEGNSIILTIAESTVNSTDLSGHHPKHAAFFNALVPHLPLINNAARDMHMLVPLLALQITSFRDSGISIGLSIQNVVADERTLNHFLKSWALICKSLLKGDSFFSVKPVPWFDRSIILDQKSLDTTLLSQWWNRMNTSPTNSSNNATGDNDIVRATFVLSTCDMNKIKREILAKCKLQNDTQPPLVLSPYVMACSFIWVCLLKAQGNENYEKPVYLGFNAGGNTRLDFHVPNTYFGNCIAFGTCMALGSELVGENGVVFAAKAIGREIKRLDRDVLGNAEKWISDWEELDVKVVGSPKVDFYEMDFGWGRPEKIDKIPVDSMNAISLTESKEFKGGIEVGVVLPNPKMIAFTSLFNDGLRVLP